MDLVPSLTCIYVGPISLFDYVLSLLVLRFPINLPQLCIPLFCHSLNKVFCAPHSRVSLKRLQRIIKRELLVPKLCDQLLYSRLEIICSVCYLLPINVDPVNFSPFDLINLGVEIVPPITKAKFLAKNPINRLLSVPPCRECPGYALSKLVPVVSVLEAKVFGIQKPKV